MPKPQFTEEQIARIVTAARTNRREWDQVLRVRRMLIGRFSEALVEGNATGTNLTYPFNRSKLIIQGMIGEVAQAVQDYASIIGTNGPKVRVPPVAVDADKVTQRVNKLAADQEALLMSMWDSAGGRAAQRRVAYSQAWGRVGWYHTYRRDASFGMPQRTYYGDMSDDELKALKDAGKVTPERLEAPDGTQAYAESGEAYIERRKAAARKQALSARSMYTLTAYPPDVVYEIPDADGPKIVFAQVEVPVFDCGPGSEYARAHHRYSGSQVDVEQYGLYYDPGQRKIVGGVTAGGERGAQSVSTWTYTIFGTRDEQYCLVGQGPESTGTIVWYDRHNLGDNPFVPAPGYRTDSRRPGHEYSSPMEGVFALAPVLNQAITFITNIMAFNSMARFVIVREDGGLLEDPDTGEPKIVMETDLIGMTSEQTGIVAGTPVQLKIDGDFAMAVVEFFTERIHEAMPSKAAVGQEGTSGTAWGLRQMIEQQLSALGEPVDNSAAASKGVYTRWIHDMKAAAAAGELETVFAIALPQTGKDNRAVRGIIEFDPADLVDAIEVIQSADTAQSKVVKQAAGIEAMQAGVETLRGYLENYTDEPDPRGKEIEIMANDMLRLAFYGDQSKIAPGSMLETLATALRGRMSLHLLDTNPAAAITTAETMASNAMQQFQQTQQQGTGAGMAKAAGVTQPGLGQSMEQPGVPGGGQIPETMPVGGMA